jgi:hypothetical protein
MNFIQIFKNYLFSSNWNLTNPNYRFSPVFYKRFLIDFFLRIFTFLPFSAFFAFMIHNGYFKETADTMLHSGQNLYGYLIVIFVYVPLFLFLMASFLISLLGIIFKRTVFQPDFDNQEVSILPKNYKEAFINSWKNFWYLTLETFVLIFLSKIIIELYVINTISISIVEILKAVLITILTSSLLASIFSLPWLKSKKNESIDSNDTVIG